MRLNNLRSVGPTKSVIKAGLDFLDMNAQKTIPPYSNSNRKNDEMDFADYFNQELKKVQ